jgi:hypothetical protein
MGQVRGKILCLRPVLLHGHTNEYFGLWLLTSCTQRILKKRLLCECFDAFEHHYGDSS